MALPDPLDLKNLVYAMLPDELPLNGDQRYRVQRAYPKQPNLLPCISVMASSGGLGPETVGESWNNGVVVDPDTQQQYETKGSYYRQSVDITVWAPNPTIRDALRPLVRQALWRIRRKLSFNNDIQNGSISEQGDNQDLENQLPFEVHTCEFVLQGVVPLIDYFPVFNADAVGVDAVWTVGGDTIP